MNFHIIEIEESERTCKICIIDIFFFSVSVHITIFQKFLVIVWHIKFQVQFQLGSYREF